MPKLLKHVDVEGMPKDLHQTSGSFHNDTPLSAGSQCLKESSQEPVPINRKLFFKEPCCERVIRLECLDCLECFND